MNSLYEYELSHAATVLCRDLLGLKEKETCLVTADTESDLRVVNVTAAAAFDCGAKPMVVTIPAPHGVGRAADPMLPAGPLTAALSEADAWIEYNNKWLLYSTPYEEALRKNKRLRHKCLVGMTADMMVRCIGRVDHAALSEFLKRVLDLTVKTRRWRFTTPAGEEVEFENSTDGNRVYGMDDGYARDPGSHFMSGQIGWTPAWETIRGTIVFDGSVVPPLCLVKEPVALDIEKGRVVRIEGGAEAKTFEQWLKSFDDPQMFVLAHTCWGFNPGAVLTGKILEDERVWGSTEWGLGEIGSCLVKPEGIPAASHADGICLNTSAWLDGEQFLAEGKVVYPGVDDLLKRLGR
jgi:2,5-dihydroxypyridine 5,6-dioxygenase